MGGFTALSLTGAITGSNQFYLGVVKAKPNPGHGKDIYENWQHVVYTRYLELASNTEPESFRSELNQLIEDGILPEVKLDCNGVEVPYTYQFFMTDEPSDMIEGFGMLQYNSVKGLIAGTTLAVSSPFVDASDKYQDLDGDYTDNHAVALEPRKGGLEGAVKGFGQGLARGFVGGLVLTGAGMIHGAQQFGRGFIALKNLPMVVDMGKQAADDYERLRSDPVYSFVFQKGYGLEEFIVAETERLREEEEKLEKLLEQRDLFRIKRAETGKPMEVIPGCDLLDEAYPGKFPDDLYTYEIVNGEKEDHQWPTLYEYPAKLRLPGELKWINRAKRLHLERLREAQELARTKKNA